MLKRRVMWKTQFGFNSGSHSLSSWHLKLHFKIYEVTNFCCHFEINLSYTLNVFLYHICIEESCQSLSNFLFQWLIYFGGGCYWVTIINSDAGNLNHNLINRLLIMSYCCHIRIYWHWMIYICVNSKLV